jgi:transcriptional regulator with XRE-family HTH domain
VPVKRRRFAARRKAVGLSQEQLAEQLHVDRSTVGRWESGETEPQPWLRPGLARVLRISPDQLDDLLTEITLASDDGDGRLKHALAHPASADLVTVAQIRQHVQDLDERYVHVPSTLLLADTSQCLGQVNFLGAHARNWRVRQELWQVKAETAVLMGQLVWDASQRRDHNSAHVYLDQAISAARQCGYQALEGLALLRKSMIALYGEANPETGLTFAHEAAQTAKSASTVLAGLAILHTADAHAMRGEPAPCEKALHDASSYFDRITASDAAIGLYSPGVYGRMAGSCYLFLGAARRAQSHLDATAALGDRSKPHAIVLGNLALACIQLGDLDEAAAHLHQAIDVLELNRGGGGLNIAFKAGRELLPWRTSPVVRDAHDRLLGLMAAS